MTSGNLELGYGSILIKNKISFKITHQIVCITSFDYAKQKDLFIGKIIFKKINITTSIASCWIRPSGPV